MALRMKHVLEFALSVLHILHIQSLSILTDIGGQNINKLGTKDIDLKSVDGLRQLMNQETIIRIVKNVYTIMKDMADLKHSMVAMKTSQQKTELKVTALQQEVNELKRENEKLIFENTRHEDTSITVKENNTQMSKYVLGLEKQLEVDRETFEKNISARLENLKVTLLELNKHTLEIDKSIPALIDQKYEILSTKLNASLETLSNDLFVSNTDISKSLFNLENSQNATMSSMFDMLVRVAFTAGLTFDSSSWNSGTLVYNKVINNVGGGYNRYTGIFTAPVVGNYIFYVSIKSYQQKSIFVDIVLNGSSKVRAGAVANPPHESYETGTNLVTLRLQQGDTVWVRYKHGYGYWVQSDTPVTTFSGFLI
ncbi:uncharacterized protein LOC133204256 [Saccostrea echinata]|uniref:uncharacterized protein LOC133204256 n=1 Tax=Saccostrea echinata TaxID=191078 RepID=UPI002A7FEB6F|nr:uncharacterized protein LOC133204256 [Saccostrea echinata]